MARPISNNCDYFSHDNNMRDNKKIKALDSEFTLPGDGMPNKRNGYLFWNILLEALTEADGHELEYCPREFKYLSGDTGFPLAITQKMVDFCIEINLIQKDELGFISSQNHIERLSPVYSKRKRDRQVSKDKKRKFPDAKINNSLIIASDNNRSLTLIDSGNIQKQQFPTQGGDESTQSKVKESKVKERKREIIQREIIPTTPEILKDSFFVFLDWMEENTPSLFLIEEFITITQFEELTINFPTEDQKIYLEYKFKQMHNRPNFLDSYKNLYFTLESWVKMDNEKAKNKIVNKN